jgi:signal transduction histidine kinase
MVDTPGSRTELDQGNLPLAIRRAQVKRLYEQGAITHFVNPVNSLIVVAALWDVVSRQALVAWWVVIALLTIYRSLDDRAFRRRDVEQLSFETLGRQLVRLAAGTTLMGVAWGVGAVVIYPAGDVVSQVLLIFVLAGMVAGAVATRTAHYGVYLAFLIPAIVPMLVRVLWDSDRLHAAMAVLLAVFVVAMSLIGRRLTRSLIAGIEHEAELTKARRAAEVASKAKSDFVAVVSHELRTPLTAIRGALGLVAEGHMGAIPEKAKRMVDIAVRNSDRLRVLIDDILDLASLEAGQLDFVIRRQGLVPIVRQSLEANATYAMTFGVSYRLAADVPDVLVDVDERRLSQVMTNLLSNAAKFSPKGTDVDVAIRRDGGSVQVRVTDKGPGVPAEFRPRLFEKFAQADSANDRRAGGTGLGL